MPLPRGERVEYQSTSPRSRRRTKLGAWVALLVGLAISLAGRRARAAGDPYLAWWTIETAHFRVHYYRGLEPVAQRVADIAESVHRRLAPVLGWRPHERTEIVLTDNVDDANGSATPIPYNTVRLFVTAPDDMSPLGDYGDFHLELVTHEYTHILHADHVEGVAAVVNAVLGKTLTPNQVQPRWLLEGLAVVEESRHSAGGRLRSSIFDMYLRADVLDDRIAPLDQVSHSARRWPQGNLWYLYGSRYLAWVVDQYGDSAMATMARDYATMFDPVTRGGGHLLPWAINRSIRRATGHTHEELWERWKADLRRSYAAQVAAAAARGGLREGTRMTWHGQIAARPRWVPPAARRDPGRAEILYYRDDAHSRAGFWRMGVDPDGRARWRDATLVARVQGNGSAAFLPDGGLLFNSVAYHARVYPYNDLFALPPDADGSTGLEPERVRLTTGARAQDPDVSPDGTRVAWTENHRGTTTLMIASRAADGTLSGARALVPSARYDQAYTPRFSPDGRKVAYSAWTAGGFRDVRVVDVATGAFVEVAHDRARDAGPSFSPDGALVYFSSDRAGGIPNVFAYEIATGRIWQVTNVRTGAFQPEPSPDGRTIAYVGYGSWGFDLWQIPVDRASWTEAPPYEDVRPDPPHVDPSVVIDRHPYEPLGTLRPRAWSFVYGPGAFGDALAICARGADVVGHHALAACLRADSNQPAPQFNLSYVYGRLPFDMSIGAFRSLVPRGGYRYSNQQPIWTEQDVGVSSGVFYAKPGPFDTQWYALSYAVARYDGSLPVGSNVDPYAPITVDPARGTIGAIHLGWAYSSAESTLHGVGAERGLVLGAGVDVAHPAIASDGTIYSLSALASGYVPMPWLRHHTLALHASAAMTGGDSARRSIFYVGGFLDTPPPGVFDVQQSRIFQGAFVLRGYRPVAFIGEQYHLYQAEYRFPILNVDRGVSTLPVFLSRVNGNLFADYGGAFDTLDTKNWRPTRLGDQFHLGVGGELWIEATLGYFLALNVRLGHARGISDPNAIEGGQTYVVIAAPY